MSTRGSWESTADEQPAPIAFQAESRLGSTLAQRWTIESVMGIGGTACVYAARHRNGRRVAIKVLHDDLASNPRVRSRFLSEGYAANKIGHPDAVAILDDGHEPNGTVFLVMELLSGQSLAQRLEREGPLPLSEVVAAAVRVLDVLAAAHDSGIVHRDVKPGNIFWTDSSGIKLLDFGAARLRDAEHLITRSGTTIGTPAFMAPELAAGRSEDVDWRSDIWSVGAVMFQLLTGKVVHAARNVHEAIVAAATRPAPPIAASCPCIPPQLGWIIDRALSFEKADRWPNARSMQAALMAAVPLTVSELRPVTGIDTHPEAAALSGPDPGDRRIDRAVRWHRWPIGTVLVGGAALLIACEIGVSSATRIQGRVPKLFGPHVTSRSRILPDVRHVVQEKIDGDPPASVEPRNSATAKPARPRITPLSSDVRTSHGATNEFSLDEMLDRRY